MVLPMRHKMFDRGEEHMGSCKEKALVNMLNTISYIAKQLLVEVEKSAQHFFEINEDANAHNKRSQSDNMLSLQMVNGDNAFVGELKLPHKKEAEQATKVDDSSKNVEAKKLANEAALLRKELKVLLRYKETRTIGEQKQRDNSEALYESDEEAERHQIYGLQEELLRVMTDNFAETASAIIGDTQVVEAHGRDKKIEIGDGHELAKSCHGHRVACFRRSFLLCLLLAALLPYRLSKPAQSSTTMASIHLADMLSKKVKPEDRLEFDDDAQSAPLVSLWDDSGGMRDVCDQLEMIFCTADDAKKYAVDEQDAFRENLVFWKPLHILNNREYTDSVQLVDNNSASGDYITDTDAPYAININVVVSVLVASDGTYNMRNDKPHLPAYNDGFGNEVYGALNVAVMVVMVSVMTQAPTQAGGSASRC